VIIYDSKVTFHYLIKIQRRRSGFFSEPKISTYSPFFYFCRTCLGTWSNNYWADCEKVLFFLNLIFMSVRILSFKAVQLPPMGQKWHILFWIFFNETSHMRRWA
jgi:hypothetical protein